VSKILLQKFWMG